ncbi:MAG: ribonuclease R [Parvibaculales bacterium]
MSERISRQKIIDFIREADGKIGKREIAKAFHIKGSEKIILKQILKEMLSNGEIVGHGREGLRLPDGLPNVGVIEVTHKNQDGDIFGKIILNGVLREHPEILITSRLHPPGIGDRVLARLKRINEAQYKASVMKKIAAPANERFIALVIQEGAHFRLTPVDRRQRYDFALETGEQTPNAGDMVWAKKLISDKRGHQNWRRSDQKAVIDEVICGADEPGAYSLIAMAEQGIPLSFNDEVKHEISLIKPLNLNNNKNYKDLRDIPFITIDPSDARDHDDAVFAIADTDEKNQGGYHVYVAIADVAAYVRPQSAMDIEARQRGNSVYMPDRVVPMLPEELSTDLCSLRPEEDRPALIVKMTINAQGQIKAHEFMRGVIQSRARLSYQQAQLAFDGAPDATCQPLQENILTPLWQAYLCMAQARDKRAPLNLDLPEYKVVMNAQKEIEDVYVPERLEAMRVIEEFMVSANICAAKSLEKHKTPLIYRIHDAPSLDKLHALADFLKPLGIAIDLGQPLNARLFNRILFGTRNQTDEQDENHSQMAQEAILRTQAQAVYSPDNIGHFGLSLSHYAHFTSPIRRYADLSVHRALIASLSLGDDGHIDLDENLISISEHISMTERRAMVAERNAKDRYLSAYLAEKIDHVFDATISGLSNAGLFVKLSDNGADGLVPISRLGSERFHKDEDGMTLTGGTTGLTFKIGQTVRVRLIKAEPVKGGLLLSLMEGGDYSPINTKPSQNKNRKSRQSFVKGIKKSPSETKGKRKGKPRKNASRKKSTSRAGRRRAKAGLKK